MSAFNLDETGVLKSFRFNLRWTTTNGSGSIEGKSNDPTAVTPMSPSATMARLIGYAVDQMVVFGHGEEAKLQLQESLRSLENKL